MDRDLRHSPISANWWTTGLGMARDSPHQEAARWSPRAFSPSASSCEPSARDRRKDKARSVMGPLLQSSRRRLLWAQREHKHSTGEGQGTGQYGHAVAPRPFGLKPRHSPFMDQKSDSFPGLSNRLATCGICRPQGFRPRVREAGQRLRSLGLVVNNCTEPCPVPTGKEETLICNNLDGHRHTYR